MKEIMCLETNFSANQIKSIKHLINNFGFDGGYIFYLVNDKNVSKAKNILGDDILRIKKK